MENSKGSNYLGNVVRIISNTTLIIDVGEDNITIGDKVQIYNVLDELKDLYGNSLGVFENVKDTLEVVQTSENYSVCKKIIVKKSSSIAALGMLATEYRYAENLNIDPEEIVPLKENIDDDKIHVGDYVKKV